MEKLLIIAELKSKFKFASEGCEAQMNLNLIYAAQKVFIAAIISE